MFFLFFGWSGFISCFVAKNSFLTYVYIQFETEFSTTKRPLIPRLARKKRLAVLGTYLVFEYTILPERMSVYSPVSDWTSKNDLCIPVWLEKIYRGWSGSISRFGADNPFLTYVHMQFWRGFFTPKRPLNLRLARKNKMAGLSSYLTSVCKSILCVFLYIVKKTQAEVWCGQTKMSLRLMVGAS